MRASELILTADGAVYHLRLHPGEVAPKIILVGDPGRVEKVAQRFSHREFTRSQREFYTITGTFEGERMTVISTGIGPDNIDITLNELDALFNIDFASRQVRPARQSLKLLRLGTCGGMQPEIPIGSIIHS
ncbi:MAG: phosphorylase, partial [Bacteroidetes bacterium]